MRLDQWTKRVSFPEGAATKLGYGYEYWKLDPSLYEASAQLASLLRGLGRKPTKRQLAYELCSHLLDDVLVAAGGVENSIIRLRNAVTELSAYASEHQLRSQNGVLHGLSHPAAVTAWYAFSDLVTWSRALVERIERPAVDRKKFREQGLLPALKPKSV